mgnify:CR=1 FL=1
MKRANIQTVGDLTELSEEELMARARNIGETSIDEIKRTILEPLCLSFRKE